MIVWTTRLSAILLTAACLLLLPLIAMQYTHEVKWDLFDFAVAALLLFGTGILCEVVMRKFTKLVPRLLLGAALLAALALVWLELAVGIFGSPLAGQ